MGLGRAKRWLVGAFAVVVLLVFAQGGSAQLPDTSLPQAPSLQTPDLPVQTPSTPQLPATPDLPDTQLPAPDVSAPDVPDVQTPQLPATPDLPDAGVSLPGSGSGSGSGSGQGTAPAQGSSGSSPGVASTTPGSAGGGSAGSSGGQTSPRGRRGVHGANFANLSQPRLERLVRRWSACLPDIPMAQRQVVVLRSGFGPGGPRGRGEVARLLGTGVSRVTTLESRGLRGLQASGEKGSCTGGGAAAAEAALTPLGLADTSGDSGGGGSSAPAGDATGEPSTGETAQADVAGQIETGGDDSDLLSLALGSPTPQPDEFKWIAMLLLLVLLAAGSVKEFFRGLAPGRAEQPAGRMRGAN